MPYQSLNQQFLEYITIDKGLSLNTQLAYSSDIERYIQFIKPLAPKVSEIIPEHIQNYLLHLVNDLKINEFSQARNLSSLRAFHKFLFIESITTTNPMDYIDSPRLNRKLPTVLSIYEIEQILNAINTSTDLGLRNRTIIEVLYSSGLRVSELINLPIQNIYPTEGFIRIIGKGNKERLVPIGSIALKFIDLYKESIRNHIQPKKGSEGILFLNRRNAKLTRVMIFLIIKELCQQAGLKKNISPHSFRHSFATHLIEGGADLKAIQEMLGHESITTTEIYTHFDTLHLREIHLTYHPRGK